MPYKLFGKASVLIDGLHVRRGDNIEDETFALLDKQRQKYFRRIVAAKAKAKKKSKTQPLPVEPVDPKDVKPVE